MQPRLAVLPLTVVLATCSSKPTSSTTPPPATPARDDTQLRVAIALAEAKRADGIAELAAFAKSEDVATRRLAIRGLGRIGGEAAMSIVMAALDDPSPEVVATAVDAIGIAASLDETPPDAKIDAALARLLASTNTDVVVAAVGAIGRAGSAEMQATLVELARTSKSDRVLDAVATAFGRYGRRKLPWSNEVRDVLVGMRETSVFWALSREHEPADDERISQRLLQGTRSDPNSFAGLARRKSKLELRIPVGVTASWAMQVEAVRYATSESATTKRVLSVVDVLDKLGTHARMEALRGLARHAKHATVHGALVGYSTKKQTDDIDEHAYSWTQCLAVAGSLQVPTSTTFEPVTKCGTDKFPDHLRLPLLAKLIEAGAGTAGARYEALRTLLAHKDARVKAAGFGALASTWKAGDDNDRRAAVSTLVAAIAHKAALIAGAAIEAAEAIYDAMDAAKDAAHGSALDGAIVARAAIETDPELTASLYKLIGKRLLVAGLEACRRGVAGHPAAVKAASECLTKLGEPKPATPAKAAMPPVDLERVIGKQLFWKIETSRGLVIVELLPERAPWAVATVVALTEKGYYDGLEFHRVVPGFVVQGGDPTESGWGGPGFSIPSEPSADAGFVTGGVGIADAGRDSGGSQWFIMHAPAPHLDGRYTWFGRVVSGQKYADELLIGDRVVKATITER